MSCEGSEVESLSTKCKGCCVHSDQVCRPAPPRPSPQMPEEEAFCVFVRLMQEYRLRELFKPSMAELGLCIYQFEYMLQEQLPDLNTHFRSQSFHTSMYASSWFLTLFLTTFPLPVATRVFDIFMYEGLEIVFRVGLALLQVNQTELMQLDMEGMSQVGQEGSEGVLHSTGPWAQEVGGLGRPWSLPPHSVLASAWRQ